VVLLLFLQKEEGRKGEGGWESKNDRTTALTRGAVLSLHSSLKERERERGEEEEEKFSRRQEELHYIPANPAVYAREGKEKKKKRGKKHPGSSL